MSLVLDLGERAGKKNKGEKKDNPRGAEERWEQGRDGGMTRTPAEALGVAPVVGKFSGGCFNLGLVTPEFQVRQEAKLVMEEQRDVRSVGDGLEVLLGSGKEAEHRKGKDWSAVLNGALHEAGPPRFIGVLYSSVLLSAVRSCQLGKAISGRSRVGRLR